MASQQQLQVLVKSDWQKAIGREEVRNGTRRVKHISQLLWHESVRRGIPAHHEAERLTVEQSRLGT